jgi:hypothetical protein
LLRVYFALSLMRGSRSGSPPPPARSRPGPAAGVRHELRLLPRAGIRMPTSRFMRAILHNYGVELDNLSPNSISQAAIFAAGCE